MPGGVQTSFLIAEFLFLGTGILITAATVLWLHERETVPTKESVARQMLLNSFPLPGRFSCVLERRDEG